MTTITATTTNNLADRTTTVTLESYYVKTKSDGWLGFKLEDDSIISLCDYTRLVYLKEQNDRVYFKINDISSTHNNRICSIKKSAFPLLFTKEAYTKKDVLLFLKYKGDTQGTLIVNGKSYTAELTHNNRIEIGTHRVMRPDSPHGLARGYGVSGNLVWFPISVASEGGTSRGRYLHVGRVSAGCISISDTDKWVEIYNYLIKYRSINDDKVVCIVKVEA